ncbi:DinB family protein [Pseudomonas sp.]|uniref:DinB family protein n=1 Tax=Pseudomonas sp. TaxID=306 RepID=UPI00344C7EBB
MINVRTAHMLAHYKQWADEQMFPSVASLPPGEATRERVTVFKNMVGCLNHIYVVDRIWQAHLEGREHEFKTRFEVPYPELDALQIAQTEINAWYRTCALQCVSVTSARPGRCR